MCMSRQAQSVCHVKQAVYVTSSMVRGPWHGKQRKQCWYVTGGLSQGKHGTSQGKHGMRQVKLGYGMRHVKLG